MNFLWISLIFQNQEMYIMGYSISIKFRLIFFNMVLRKFIPPSTMIINKKYSYIDNENKLKNTRCSELSFSKICSDVWQHWWNQGNPKKVTCFSTQISFECLNGCYGCPADWSSLPSTKYQWRKLWKFFALALTRNNNRNFERNYK